MLDLPVDWHCFYIKLSDRGASDGDPFPFREVGFNSTTTEAAALTISFMSHTGY